MRQHFLGFFGFASTVSSADPRNIHNIWNKRATSSASETLNPKADSSIPVFGAQRLDSTVSELSLQELKV